MHLNHFGNPLLSKAAELQATNREVMTVHVRERGKFWPVPIKLRMPSTFKILERMTLTALAGPEALSKEVYAIYNHYDRSQKITTDDHVNQLSPHTILEVILVSTITTSSPH